MILFHQKLSQQSLVLRRLYLQNKVKRKKVRQEKYLPESFKPKYFDKRKKMLEALAKAETEQRKLIFLDEINFTKLSIPGKDWSVKRDNQHID